MMWETIWTMKEGKNEAWLNLHTETGKGELFIRKHKRTRANIESIEIDKSELLILAENIKIELVKIRFPKFTESRACKEDLTK